MNSYSKSQITVVVITYKQETVISRCLESILTQKDFGLKEIIVSDDCSPDKTWDIVLKYKSQYPEIIKVNRNFTNQGIYGNLSKAYELVDDTDFVINCSGDDILCDGFLEAICNYVYANQLKPQNSSFVIYGDYKIILPNNIEKVIKNDILLKEGKAIDFRLRHLLSNRSSAISIECFRKFDKIPYEKSVSMAEEICDIQQILYSDCNYYIPIVGSAYYAGIGVSTKMGNTKDRQERIESWLYLLNNYTVSIKTKHSMLYDINRLRYANCKKINIFFQTWYHFVLAGNLSSVSNIKMMIREMFLMIFSSYDTIVC